jgi:hypothetical protein
MREIVLTRGHVALVDDGDYESLVDVNWLFTDNGNGNFYAVRKPRAGIDPPKPSSIYMHRELLKPADGLLIDHINGNGLDNRRQNLRLATKAENMRNRGPVKNFAFKGIYRVSDECWGVQCTGFSTPEEAARAYDSISILAHGEFAYQNFPKDTV